MAVAVIQRIRGLAPSKLFTRVRFPSPAPKPLIDLSHSDWYATGPVIGEDHRPRRDDEGDDRVADRKAAVGTGTELVYPPRRRQSPVWMAWPGPAS
jgi:hypothetical protein